MNVLSVLFVFFILAVVIKIATDNLADMLSLISWFKNARKYKLVIAFIFTIIGIVGLNYGILEALQVQSVVSVSYDWFHEFDLVLTSFFLAKGAQAIHRLDNAIKSYKAKAGGNNAEQ